MPMSSLAPVRRGLTRRDVLTIVSLAGVSFCVLVPTLGAMRNDDRIAVSMNNLRIIFQSHMTYAGDFDERQLTHTPDNLSEILNFGGYPATYSTGGSQGQVPSVPLGFDCTGEFYETRSGLFIQQMYYAGNCSLGNFRAWNCQPFHQYVNGKVYDPTFWAPKDPTPQDHPEIQAYWKLDCEWPGPDTTFWYPTYCLAVSSQFDPLVFANDDIGQTRALNLPFGHQTPTLSQTRYPDLKTFMLEHYWLQNAPKDPYIPGTTVPYYFNMGLDSVPVTLFYDGQVRLMAQTEAITSDQIVTMSGRPSLIVSNEPHCFGDELYFESYGYKGEDVSSYHVFTADGILGRDTIFASHDAGGKRDSE